MIKQKKKSKKKLEKAEEYQEEMRQLGIDSLHFHTIDFGGCTAYQHYTNGERMAINLALKLQRQLNELKQG